MRVSLKNKFLREQVRYQQWASKNCLVKSFYLVAYSYVQTSFPPRYLLGEGASVHRLKLGGSGGLKNRDRLRNRRRSF